MKTINLIAVIIFTSLTIFAANDKVPASPVANATIKGIVIDKITGEALAGVKIDLVNSNNAVYTDLDGNFEFTDVKTGTHNIKTNLISYKSSVIEINCNSKTNDIEISLDNK